MIDLGLDRMSIMVNRLGLQKPASKIITVAGTNGKGSTAVACEGLLMLSGARVGTTLSPHLFRFNERIRLNGIEVDNEVLCAAFSAVEAERGGITLTYFEYSALVALWVFKLNTLDVVILEIGLGGRLDAFNVIDADVGIITSIGLDHQDFLGDNLESIGAEKAGILRLGQQVVLGPDLPKSVHQRCEELQIMPQIYGEVYAAQAESGHHGWCFKRGSSRLVGHLPWGQCAPQNLVLAYLAVQTFRPVTPEDLKAAAVTLKLPGRMQSMSFGSRTWMLDVAHNPAGAKFLVAQLKQRNVAPALVVCGMLEGKDPTGLYAEIDGQFRVPWLLVSTAGERATSGQALKQALGPDPSISVCDWSVILGEVYSATNEGDVILVLGSFNVVEQANQILSVIGQG